MPELSFQIRGAEAVRASVGPTIALDLEIANARADETIQSVVLSCQIQIEAPRRRYSAEEQTRLRDLFGEPERWGQTLRPLLWANVTTTVPGFTGSICIKVPIPCTADFGGTAGKYFHGVESGTVPITAMFSGTVFYRNDGRLEAAPIPRDAEARFAMPVGIWKECIELHHPNTQWLGLRRDNFERLYEFKVRHGFASFDEAIERMLAETLEAKA